ncbi:MAG: hypothetical protein J6Y69_09655 [Treponema sp.]|nr:hypothetical protein [Treponema sp.]
MADFSLSQAQTQIQSQVQVMSQRQIQSLEILSLSSADLREAVYKAAEENPALEIVRDKLESGVDLKKRSAGYDGTKISSLHSHALEEASDTFQATLESRADEKEPLQDYLIHQLNMLELTESEKSLGQHLIHNLDDRGFHRLSPISLLDSSDKNQNEQMLKRMMDLIQGFDPTGTCTSGPEESLLVQAKAKNAPSLALFILDGHLNFLDPPITAKAQKKIESFIQEQKSLFGYDTTKTDSLTVNEKTVEEAITFIKTLEPFPAGNFTSSQTHFVAPDIYIEEKGSDNGEIPEEELNKNGLYSAGGKIWRIKMANETIPTLSVNKDFINSLNLDGINKNEHRMMEQNIKQAKEFIQILELRKSTLERAAKEILRHQADFFIKGPGHIRPFLQSELANILEVHESTVSRLANGKYIECQWGFYELKYFFSHASSTSSTGQNTSKEAVLHKMEQILAEHQNDKKPLSDSKLCELLSAQGIQISRRTVTKYRSQLNIGSSYER